MADALSAIATPVFPMAAPLESGSICKNGTAVMATCAWVENETPRSRVRLRINGLKRAENKDFFIVCIILKTF
jgi:hypothetical protein